MLLKIGNQAPEFKLQNQDGENILDNPALVTVNYLVIAGGGGGAGYGGNGNGQGGGGVDFPGIFSKPRYPPNRRRDGGRGTLLAQRHIH